MEFWSEIRVLCDNPAAVSACGLAIKNCAAAYGLEMEDETEICAAMPDYVPHQEIKDVSTQFPNDDITFIYTCVATGASDFHIVTYRKGIVEKVDISPAYVHEHLSCININDRDGIFSKVMSLCHKLDTAGKDKEGNMFINWFNDEVCYKFTYDGLDGKKFKVEATKRRDQIDLKLYEGRPKYDWRKIHPASPKVMHNPL